MSRYFDALNRLRRDRDAASRPGLHPAGEAGPAADTIHEETESGAGLTFPELQLASRQASYAALLDLLRATTRQSAIPAVVIAGVSGGEPVHEVVAGISLQAQRQGVTLKCGRLSIAAGARTLSISSQPPLRDAALPVGADDSASLRLSGSQGPEALREWLERAATESDLLLIEAPPLGSSVDAALLGAAGEGMVLVAETLVTERAKLREAVERARPAGGKILGLVLTGTRPWLPRWVRRLLGLVGRS